MFLQTILNQLLNPPKVWNASASYHSMWPLYTNGLAHNSSKSTSVDGVVIKGEWIQIKYNVLHSVNRIRIYQWRAKWDGTQNPYYRRYPKKYYIVGSNNGTDWTEIHRNENVPSVKDLIPIGWNLAWQHPDYETTTENRYKVRLHYYDDTFNNARYKYYRIIINEIYGIILLNSVSYFLF